MFKASMAPIPINMIPISDVLLSLFIDLKLEKCWKVNKRELYKEVLMLFEKAHFLLLLPSFQSPAHVVELVDTPS